MIRLALAVTALACLPGCPQTATTGAGGGSGGGADAGPLSCRPCSTTSDCDSNGSCTQYSGDNFCAKDCLTDADCAASESCALDSDFSGGQVRVCLPLTGSCTPGAGCGVCPAGTTCDLTNGTCAAAPDAGSPPVDGGACGTKVPPATSSCCHSCSSGTVGCQANGCYGGWWCDSANPSSCSCKTPPTSCGSADAGAADAGVLDAGLPGGLIGPSGGTVNRLFFAVVGDTRPPSPVNAVANYPTAIITKIYADIAAMTPRPQFVVATGDYQFSSPNGSDAAAQFGLYLGAKNQYPGVVFAAMGNHECTSATLSNCIGTFARNNYDAYLAALVTPIGKTTPYYSIPVQTSAGAASFIVVACNAWDATQKAWLQTELASAAPFKFIVRHESLTAAAPCTSEVNPMLAATNYSLLLVGHTHLFSHSAKELIVGMGGAPITGSTPYGYVTVEQLGGGGGWRVVQYDSTTSLPVQAFTVP